MMKARKGTKIIISLCLAIILVALAFVSVFARQDTVNGFVCVATSSGGVFKATVNSPSAHGNLSVSLKGPYQDSNGSNQANNSNSANWAYTCSVSRPYAGTMVYNGITASFYASASGKHLDNYQIKGGF